MFNAARNKLKIKKLKIKIFFNLQGWAKGALTLPLKKIFEKKIFTKNFLKKFILCCQNVLIRYRSGLLIFEGSKIFYFLDSASDLEFNKPYFETVAAAIAEKTPLLNSKIWT